MNNFPLAVNPLPDHGSPIQKTGAVIEMKCDDRDSVGDILDQEILGLDIHIWRERPIAADPREDSLEGSFDFRSPTYRTGTKDSRIVVE